jgi:hypothetical protein
VGVAEARAVSVPDQFAAMAIRLERLRSSIGGMA